LQQLKQLCAESGLETFCSKSVETCLMAFYLQSNSIEYCQDQEFGKS